MISGPEIRRLVTRGDAIKIDPYNEQHLNPNSLDLTLAPELLVYQTMTTDDVLDVCKEPKTKKLLIPKEGLVLYPGVLYLGSSVEYTESYGYVPQVNGKSSLGRLGILVHQTAGFGDDGFCGPFTLEISVIHPVKIYPLMRICQICWQPIIGERMPYVGKYQRQVGPTPYRVSKEQQ